MSYRTRSLVARWRPLGLALAGLCVLSTATLAQEAVVSKIAVVDLDRVVVASKAGQALQQRLANLEQQTQAQLEEKAQLIQNLRDSLAGKSGEEARQIQKRIEDETLAARRLREDAERQANKMQQEELERIRAQLQPVIEQIQQEEAYDLILNYNPAILISVSNRIDLTARVLELLDAGN